ncbi:MAG: serine/threonine-protein kinase [Planctomycetota bacterium]
MAEHLEACDQCQTRLEELTEEGVSINEAGALLRNDDLDILSVSDSLVQSDETPSFLEITDHPGSIGRFGRYEIMEILGRGGMGLVMRGYDPALNRHSAITVLAPEWASSAAARQRFSREAKSAAAVVHAHVVPIQTVDEHASLPYLVMPVVEGMSLQQRVSTDGPLQILETTRIASQIAEGLAAAHAQGLVHRDIKPANVLLQNGIERVQITDFGLARAADDASMTRSGVIAGTPQYMSPEQAHGDEIDHRSDLFSLGSVIYFMLTGRSPFRAENTMGVLTRIVHDEPRNLAAIRSDLPAWLNSIVMRLLEKKREKRFESAEALAKELNARLVELQDPTSKPSSRPIAGRLIPPMSLSWIACGAACVLGLASLFLIETDQGVIRIETNSTSNVPIRIRQGNEVVERLVVDSNGVSTRVRTGSYVIEIDGDDTAFELKNKEAVVTANGEWVTKINFVAAKDVLDWKLSKNPSEVLRMASEDTRFARYEDALEKTLWYWDNAVKIQPAQSAVRRSFLLSDWLELGEAYPPALEKLKSVRDALKTQVLSTDQIRVRSKDFADLASINAILRQDEETVKVYNTIHDRDPEDALRNRFFLPDEAKAAANKEAEAAQEAAAAKRKR